MLTKFETLFAAALANPNICTGKAHNYQLTNWFGPHATGITQEQIVTRQAEDAANEALRRLEKLSK